MRDPEKVYHFVAPALLLSMPQMNDPNFTKTVVLLCEHSAGGAFGLVLNRPTNTPAADAVQLDPPVERGHHEISLWMGGPVEPQRGWILIGEQPEDIESLRICDGLFLSTSAVLLRRLLERTPPPRTRLLNGYAGWGPGQLDMELGASAWLTTDIDLEIVFETEASLMWEKAIRRLGADPGMLQMSHGVH